MQSLIKHNLGPELCLRYDFVCCRWLFERNHGDLYIPYTCTLILYDKINKEYCRDVSRRIYCNRDKRFTPMTSNLSNTLKGLHRPCYLSLRFSVRDKLKWGLDTTLPVLAFWRVWHKKSHTHPNEKVL